LTTDFFPFEEIRKRDGRVVPFDAEKITQAIFKAARAVGGENYSLARELTTEVIVYLSEQKLSGLIPTVEEIQDAVEKVLIEKGHARTAKAYILYRAKRTRIREAKSELMDAVKEILLEGNRKEEEANFSPAEKMNRIALAASQKYYLDNLLPPEIAAAHQEGSFYIHSLGYYSKALDSLQIDLQPLLRNEFASEEFPPGDLLAALLRVSAILQKNKNDLYGEQALPYFDRVVGQLIRSIKNKPSRKELYRNLKEILAYWGKLFCTSAGNTPHCSLQLGLDTTEEGREVAKVLLEESIKRQCPKLVFIIKKGVNLREGDPNYDLYQTALRAALRSGNPFFAFLDTDYNIPFDEEVCYFSNGMRIAGNRHGLPGGMGRGNIASLTLNLPRLALSSLEQELFFVELDRLLRLGVRQLLHRFEVLSSLKCKDLPFLMGERLYLGSENLSSEDSIKESLKNGVISISFTGLSEAARVLTERNQEKELEYGLAVKIAEHMSRRIKSFADEYDLNIALCGSSGSDRLQDLVAKDREDFGLVRGVTDKDYYYSSCFVLFQEDEGLEKKIALEGEIHKCCSAGYASRMVLLPGMDVEVAEEMAARLIAAGVGFITIAPLTKE
jgi:ribonucleoside-triphosphate reductase